MGFLAVMMANRAFCAITVVTVLAFTSQLSLLLWFSHEDKNNTYSDKSLFFIVLLYGFLMGSLIIVLSNYYDGEKFLLSDPDAALYYREGIKSTNTGFVDHAKRILIQHPFTDWGALFFSSFMLNIIPSCYFINCFYIVSGAVAAVLLFRIGNHIMPKPYAYLAALAYSTSSFLILLHCTCLKESIFSLCVICALYFFYKSITSKDHWALFGAIVFVVFVAFFRTAVVAFILMSFVTYYAITQRGSAISLFLYLIIAVGLLVSMAYLQSQVDNYTAGGDSDAILEESGSQNYSGGFNYFVGWFASLFGPFPTLFPTESAGPMPMIFYGAGLVYKLFIVVPFWVGVFFVLKRFDILTIPLVVFVMIEILAAAYVLASFELRKVLLHIPFTYILSFYGLYQLDNNKANYKTNQLLEFVGYAMTVGILLLWNVIRVK